MNNLGPNHGPEGTSIVGANLKISHAYIEYFAAIKSGKISWNITPAKIICHQQHKNEPIEIQKR